MPTKLDKTFDGWYTDEALTEALVETDVMTEDTTLYAAYIDATITLTFSLDGGTYGDDGGVFEVENGITLQAFVSAEGTPTKTDYTFNQFYYDEALTETADFYAEITEDTTFYLEYYITVFDVTFSLDGGAFDPVVTTHETTFGDTMNDIIAIVGAPTKAGNTFDGWYNDAGLTVPTVLTDAIYEATTKYAKWTAN